MSEFVTVARAEDLPPGQVEVFEVGYDYVAIANVDGEFCAFADVCTHDGGPLVEGDLEGRVITCPRHGARFDVCSGDVLQLPAVVPLPTFEVRVVDGEVQVRVEE
jgi:3-phenylpropionate/trans-cinnamate dioxygenase ferredoxin component